MRILGVLIFVLIAVPISANEGRFSWNQLWWQSVEMLHRTAHDENIISTYTANSATELNRTICEMNGGPEAYDAAKESIRQYFTCIRPLTEQIVAGVGNSSSELSDHRISGIMTTVACPLLPDVKSCFKNIFDANKPCLRPDRAEYAEHTLKVAIPILEFMCKDGGKWIRDFSAVDGNACVASKEEAVGECVFTVLEGPDKGSMVTKLPPRIKRLNVPWLNQYIDDCADLGKFELCALRELAKCQTPAPSILVNALLDMVKSVASCENLVDGKT